MNKEVVSSAIVEGNMTIKSKRQLSQIIDTTLLKCYIQVKAMDFLLFLIVYLEAVRCLMYLKTSYKFLLLLKSSS